MNNIIIGTAGHVDHGKTSLIKALTGIDTDRLKQEKERGITIELGFAWFDLPDGRRAGIIDVPGHEKFVRNMLAGAAGIDVVLLVVAADEGVMPQTREHLDILSLLEVKTGIVVITKADLVEPELLELAREEIDEALAGTFLSEAPRVEVSVIDGRGLDQLREVIGQVAVSAPPRIRRAFSRLPLDRVFVQKGFGTVVTGTLLDGPLNRGDQAVVMPGEIQARVRNIQVHGDETENAQPGQRVAVNLAGVERQQIHRGQVLFKGEHIRPVDKVAARLFMLPGSSALVSNTRIRFHCGSSETIGRAVVLGKEKLEPGEDGLVQFRLEQPIVAVRGDRYVIRSWSPITTIGGGEIIEVSRRRLSRRKPAVVESLLVKEQGEPQRLVMEYLDESSVPLSRKELLARTQLAPEQLDEVFNENSGVVSFSGEGDTWYFSGGQQLLEELKRLLEDWHRQHPLRQGMAKEEVRSRLLPRTSSRGFSQLLENLLPGNGMEVRGQLLALSTHQVEMSTEQKALAEKIMQALERQPFAPPSREELAQMGDVTPVLKLLQQQGEIVEAEQFWFSRTALEEAIARIQQHFSVEKELTLAQFRDSLGTTRKYAVPLMEYLDGKHITRRRGDVRMAGSKLWGD